MASQHRIDNSGYAAHDANGVLQPFRFTTRRPLADELLIRVLWCGVCHTDIHMARNEWNNTHYPCVPGHEFVGVVEVVGADETGEEAVTGQKFDKGDYVGVGFMCDSCGSCTACKDDRQMHCANQVDTFSGFTRSEWTTGGYSQYAVVRKAFVVRIPKDMPRIEDVAPLMCAGITTYSPILANNMQRGNLRIGVIGLGGLGHLAVQFAHKVNETNQVYVVSRSKGKEALAKELGAIAMISIGSEECTKEFNNTFDYILDTVAVAGKPMDLYMKLLKPLGTLITVGIPPLNEVIPMPLLELVTKNCCIQGSLVGGIGQMQSMIDFCYKHHVLPVCEHARLDQINEAFQRILKSDVKFRFVVDVADSLPITQEVGSGKH